MKKLLLACLATAVVAPAASAATSVCVGGPDPAGDVTPATDDPPFTIGGTPFAPAADLVSTHAVAGPGGMTATFVLAGDPAPPPGLNYEYWFEFHDDTTQYHLAAAVDGGVTLNRTPFGLFHRPVADEGEPVESWTAVPVTGTVDVATRTVTVTAPPSAFGLTAFGAGQSWTATGFRTMFGQAGTAAGPQDVAPVTGALVAGDGTCA